MVLDTHPTMPAIVIDVQTLAKAVETMGIATSVDTTALFDCLAQEAQRNPPQPPPLDPTKKQKPVAGKKLVSFK